MKFTLGQTLCSQCKKSTAIALCSGCEEGFCTKHFLRHRLEMATQMDDLHHQYQLFQQSIGEDQGEHPLISKIDAWERKSIEKVQEMAEAARQDLRQRMEKSKTEVSQTLETVFAEFQAQEKIDSYTEIHLKQWSEQLDQLKELINDSTAFSLVEKKKSPEVIGVLKLRQKSARTSSLSTSSSITEMSFSERFLPVFGQCQLADDNRLVTQSNYRAGLSQVTGVNEYSSGKHFLRFLIEKKGTKNLFIGIHSISTQIKTTTLDASVYGWWNFDYVVNNGQADEAGSNTEFFRTGDQLTLIIDCDDRTIQLEHPRSSSLFQLPVQLELCPFPWKILVRLLTAGDSLRLLF